MSKFIVVVALFITCTLSAQTYLDSTASIEVPVTDLLSRMTLDEKIDHIPTKQCEYFSDSSGRDVGLVKYSNIILIK